MLVWSRFPLVVLEMTSWGNGNGTVKVTAKFGGLVVRGSVRSVGGSELARRRRMRVGCGVSCVFFALNLLTIARVRRAGIYMTVCGGFEAIVFVCPHC